MSKQKAVDFNNEGVVDEGVVVEFCIGYEDFRNYFSGKSIGQGLSSKPLEESKYKLPVWNREGLTDEKSINDNVVNLMVHQEAFEEFNKILNGRPQIIYPQTDKKLQKAERKPQETSRAIQCNLLDRIKDAQEKLNDEALAEVSTDEGESDEGDALAEVSTDED